MISRHCDNLILYSWNSPVLKDLRCGCAAGVNLALHAPLDLNREKVLNNRRLLAEELGVNPKDWICADQVHGSLSRVLRADDTGRGALKASNALEATDALILPEPGLRAMIFTADCLPLLLYDRRTGAAALIHAGWRGAASGIAVKTLERMCGEFGCRREDIFAAAGPAVGSCCYQVDAPVYEGLTIPFPETAAAFSPDVQADLSRGSDKRWRLNLEEAVFLQLERAGIGRESMEESGLCSACSSPYLSSWRREGPSAGRMGTFFCS